MAQADLGVHMTLGAHGGYPLARSQLQGLAGALADVVLGERSAPPFHALVQSADRRICFWATRMLPGVHQGGIQVKVAFYKAWYEQPAMEIDLSVSFIVQARRAAAHPSLVASPAFSLLRQRQATLDLELKDRRDGYNDAVRL